MAKTKLVRNTTSLCDGLESGDNIIIDKETINEFMANEQIELTQEIYDDIKNGLEVREPEIEENFNFFDLDGNGEISMKEFSKAMKILYKSGFFPEKLSKKELKKMFKTADLDKNGGISLEEYKLMVC